MLHGQRHLELSSGTCSWCMVSWLTLKGFGSQNQLGLLDRCGTCLTSTERLGQWFGTSMGVCFPEKTACEKNIDALSNLCACCNYCPTGSTRELGYWCYGEKYVTPKCMQLSPNPLWLYWGPCLQDNDLKLLEGVRLNLSRCRLVSRMRIQISLFQPQEPW